MAEVYYDKIALSLENYPEITEAWQATRQILIRSKREHAEKE